MRKIITILFVSITTIGYAQNEIKPTILFGDFGGISSNISIKLNRVYKINPKISYSYELGASPFFNRTVSAGWSALLLNKNNSSLELGLSIDIDKYFEPLFLVLVAYRYQNLKNSRTFARIGITPIGVDGRGVGFAAIPVLGLGYIIK